MSEFNLSEKIRFGELSSYCIERLDWIKAKDVKEFIKRLKELIDDHCWEPYCNKFKMKIDKLAGDDLNGKTNNT